MYKFYLKEGNMRILQIAVLTLMPLVGLILCAVGIVWLGIAMLTSWAMAIGFFVSLMFTE